MCKDLIDLSLDTIAKAIDRDEVRLLTTSEPDEMRISEEELFYLTAGVYIVHIGVDDHLEHHLRVIGAATHRVVKFFEWL